MRRRGGTVLALLITALLGLAILGPTGAAAKRHHRPKPPSTAQRLSRLSKQLGGLPRSSWARGRRRTVLGTLSGGQSALSRRATCSAVMTLDGAHTALLARSTWAHGVPRSVSRSLAPALASIEQALVKGHSACGARSYTVASRPSSLVGGSGFAPVPTIQTTNGQGGDDEEAAVTIGPYRPITDTGPASTPAADPQFPDTGTTGASPDLRAPFGAPRGRAAADLGDPAEFGSSIVGVEPRSGGEPKEPTVAIGHNVAWYTGNTSAGYSLDGGKTWTLLDPSTILKDPPNNALCCDQVVVYAPKQNLFVWELQYWCPNGPLLSGAAGMANACSQVNGNDIIRFAVASPDDIRTQAAAGHVGNAWHIVDDLTPQSIGQPANAWFDYSTLSVNDGYVNWTVDIFRGNNKAVAMRINTNSLAQYRFQAEYFFLAFHPAAAQEPPGTLTSYFAANNNTSQVRMYSWASGSATPIAHDVDIPSIPTVNTQVNGTDGTDWNARASIPIGNVESAAWSDNELLVAYVGGRDQCTKGCGGASPTLQNVFPHTVAILDGVDTNAKNGAWTNTRITKYIHSDTLNYSWPSLGVAASGLVGITLEGAADGQNPRAVAGALDDNYDIHGVWVSDPGAGPQPGTALPAPASGFSGGTGDYYSLEPGPSFQSFVMPYRSIDPAPGGGSSDNFHFVYYGYGQPITPAPPFVTITAPTDGASFPEGTPVTFNANVSDALDGQLPYDAIVWSIDGVTSPFRGTLVRDGSLSVGAHTISVTATNSSGLSRTQTVHITVLAPQPGEPTAQIDSPADGSAFPATGTDSGGEYVDVPMHAEASDPEGRQLFFTWSDEITQNGNTTVFTNLSSDLSPTLRLHVDSNCGVASHKLTLTAASVAGGVSVSTTVTVTSQICVKIRR